LGAGWQGDWPALRLASLIDAEQVEAGGSDKERAGWLQKSCWLATGCWLRLPASFALLYRTTSALVCFDGRCCCAGETRRKLQAQENYSLREAQSNQTYKYDT